MAAIPLQRPVEYPESDGQPMGETELHVQEMMYLLAAFQEHFRKSADVYVASNLFFYYEQGNPRAVVSPDLFVVPGAAKEPPRRTYLLWKEGGRVPCLVIEVTSDNTRHEDLSRKRRTYAELGVEEYFLFDPFEEYLDPPLQGFRLESSHYREAELEPDGSLVSRTTGVTLRREGQRIRVVDTATGEPYLRYEEVVAARRAAEEELARLRRELELR
jgi:Uma2 family endonuclease